MRPRALPLLTVVLVATLLPLGCARQEAAVEVAPVDETFARASVIFSPLPEVAGNPNNELTEAKVALGRQLYSDPQLSKRGDISCASCHSLATFGVDNLPTSPGDRGQHGNRNSPTVLNAALHAAQFWDGRAAAVEEQAGMPILNPVEMAIPSEQFLVDRLSKLDGYPEAFAAAFPESEQALTYANIRNALAAFERTLITPSRFDQYLRGDQAALTSDEKDGLRLFMTLGCGACHNGVTLGGHAFRKFGLNEPYWVHTKSANVDEGRAGVTGNEEDKYIFKIAALRNVAQTGPYFHDGSVESLEEALGIMARVQVGAELSERQLAQMAAFLGSLTGDLPESAAEAAGGG